MPIAERPLALGLGLGLAVGLSWPAPLHLAGRVLASPVSEADNHLWMLQVATRRLAGRPGPWANWPEGWEPPLMDPVNLPFALLGGVGGPVLAFNLVVLANLALALGGGWALGRAVGGERGALVGMAALGGAPFFWGVVDFGLTEALGLGWLALHVAALERWGEHGRPRALVVSGLTLAAFLATGWYHALFAALVEPALLLRAWRRRGQAVALLAHAALAALPRLPDLAATRASSRLWADRLHGIGGPESWSWWRDLPDQGADLLTFVLPRLDAAPASRTVYLGLLLLLFALAGGRKARPWLLLGGGLLLFALGPWVRVGGVSPLGIGWLGPAGALTRLLPPLEAITHWDRATGPAMVFLAAAAAAGAERWLPDRRVALVVALGIVAEATALAPTAWPRHTYAPDPPAELSALDGQGALLQLPVDDAGSPPRARSRRPYNQWQAWHRRPVSENYEGPDAVLPAVPAVATLNGACGAPLPPRAPKILPADPAPTRERLRALGYDWILVHPELAREPARCVDAARAWLGTPTLETARTLGWRL